MLTGELERNLHFLQHFKVLLERHSRRPQIGPDNPHLHIIHSGYDDRSAHSVFHHNDMRAALAVHSEADGLENFDQPAPINGRKFIH